MYRGTIASGDVRKRTFGHKGLDTWDIHHAYKHGGVVNGVVRQSTLHVYLAEPTKSLDDKGRPVPWTDARFDVYIPLDGGKHRVHHPKLNWGDEFWVPIEGWGITSVVSLDGAPPAIFWEVLPGKA